MDMEKDIQLYGMELKSVYDNNIKMNGYTKFESAEQKMKYLILDGAIRNIIFRKDANLLFDNFRRNKIFKKITKDYNIFYIIEIQITSFLYSDLRLKTVPIKLLNKDGTCLENDIYESQDINIPKTLLINGFSTKTILKKDKDSFVRDIVYEIDII